MNTVYVMRYVKKNCSIGKLLYIDDNVQLKRILLHVTGGDELGLWWSAIITVAINWLAGDEENAEAQYPMCDSFPQKLQQSE